MNVNELDILILEASRPRWKKVAMVLALVTRDHRFVADETVDAFDMVAARIVELRNVGRLESQGDISNWRFSEVRVASRSQME